MARIRMAPADRKAAILEAAIAVAERLGFSHLRLAHIATEAECSNAIVVKYYGTMVQMRRAVMREAIKRRLLPIIANGIAMGDPNAKKVSDDLKREAIATLSA